MAELEKFAAEYEPIEKLMGEFTELAKSFPNGKAVDDDEEFGKQVQEELGLPDF